MQWTVIIPIRALPEAKSRLAATVTDPRAHAELVRAIRADTVDAAIRADGVARILVVADHPSVEVGPNATAVVVQRSPGLNAGLREAAEYAARQWPADGVAALVGDLPAMQPADLAAVLASAAEVDSGFVADTDGVGTTVLTARPGVALRPDFGDASAGRHGQHAVALAAGAGLRRDVDTEADLFQALELGAGPRTSAAATAITSCSR